MTPKDFENQHFLDETNGKTSAEEEEQEFKEEEVSSLRSNPNARFEIRLTLLEKVAVVIIMFLIISNAISLNQWRRAISETCIRPKLVYSPAKAEGAIQYARKTLYRDIDNNKFTGEPREELDNAWHDLLTPMVIKISLEELKAIEPKSKPAISLKDGTGYIAETAVFHELHCIKRLRRHLYSNFYYPNSDEDELERERFHIDHCLEYLREAAICRGDTVLDTFFWRDGKPVSYQVTDHECVNWEKLTDWAEKRMVNSSDFGLLNRGMNNWD